MHAHVRFISVLMQLHFCIDGMEHAHSVLPGGTIKDLRRSSMLTWYLPLERRTSLETFKLFLYLVNHWHELTLVPQYIMKNII